jgi:hypothetical protein
MVRGRHADGRQLEPVSEPLLLTSPRSLALPGLDHGRRATAGTLDAVEARWPRIEALAGQDEKAAAIAALEALAAEMRALTAADPEPWRATLEASRGILYDDIAGLGARADLRDAALAALARCRSWDVELRGHLDQQIAALGRDR